MYTTYLRLNVSIYDSDITVIRAAKLKLKPAFRYERTMRFERHNFYRQMLKYHHETRETAKTFHL
jgi:hypothetical protein